MNTKCVTTHLVKYLNEIYPGVTDKCGKVHTYLGMTFDFGTKGKVAISMTLYLG